MVKTGFSLAEACRDAGLRRLVLIPCGLFNNELNPSASATDPGSDRIEGECGKGSATTSALGGMPRGQISFSQGHEYSGTWGQRPRARLQGELFKEYFSSALFKNNADDMNRELANFFLSFFLSRNVSDRLHNGDISTTKFPTFEEVLGLTGLAIIRKESFRNFDIENRVTNSGRLRFMAQYLVFLVAKVLDDRLRRHAIHHRKLVESLHTANRLKNVVFISTNYDILIDNALTEVKAQGIDLDYGVEFRNFDEGGWARPALDNRIQLFKPHGSLNWLFCPTSSVLPAIRNCRSKGF